MSRKTTVKLVGFVGALGISAALIAAASSTTGAYFTDEKAGNLQGSSGILQINADGQNIDFKGLIPGTDKSSTINYSVRSDSNTNADIWLVFNAQSDAYGAFTGAKDNDHHTYPTVTDGGLGGYGHFKVRSNQGYHFESYNLQLLTADKATGAYNNGTCHVDANGNGGDTHKATGPDNSTQAAPECGVPAAIKIGSNIAPGTGSSAVITFGLTGKATAQNVPWVNVPFKIVGTQPGVRPDALNY